MAKAKSKPMNQGLAAAKVAKKDEFYTLYVDIQKEVEAYLEFDEDTFRSKGSENFKLAKYVLECIKKI